MKQNLRKLYEGKPFFLWDSSFWGCFSFYPIVLKVSKTLCYASSCTSFGGLTRQQYFIKSLMDILSLSALSFRVFFSCSVSLTLTTSVFTVLHLSLKALSAVLNILLCFDWSFQCFHQCIFRMHPQKCPHHRAFLSYLEGYNHR